MQDPHPPPQGGKRGPGTDEGTDSRAHFRIFYAPRVKIRKEGFFGGWAGEEEEEEEGGFFAPPFAADGGGGNGSERARDPPTTENAPEDRARKPVRASPERR